MNGGASDAAVGGYILGERLGAGGTATVYRARRGAEEVALKLLHPHLARDEVVRARFIREVAVARRLSHPSIVRVYDLVSWEGSLALVMELCGGGSLAGWRASSADEIVRVATDVAGALAAAHELGIVHRDLKPQNVLRDSGGRCKVCDFGSAGVQDSVGLTTSSLLIGTPQYVAPEVFTGHPADPRADLYALGVILFEAATGSLPRPGGLSAAAYARPVDLGPLRAALPDWLATVVGRLLGPVESRPPDARSLLRALRTAEPPMPVALKRCLFCGASIPLSAPLCLHCGEEGLALEPPPEGEGWCVALRRVTEEAGTLGRLTEVLRAVSGDTSFELDLLIGDARMYSREERKRKARLPVRLVEGLARRDAERFARILGGLGARASAHPMRAARRFRRGPLVRARPGAVVVPEALDVLRGGAASVPSLPDPWMRSLAASLLFAVYDLEARASSHELRDVLRRSCLELREISERLIRDLAAARELVSGVDRGALYAEVARANLRSAEEPADPEGRKARALEELGKHESAEIDQSRLVARMLRVSDLVADLARRLGPSRAQRDRAELDSALAELEAELRA